MDRGQPDEDTPDLAAGEGPLADDRAVRTDERDPAGEVDAKPPGRAGPGRQRFANHAA